MTKNYNEYFIKNPDKITKLIGNTFYGRSGSYLFCSLFDNHPDLLTIPFWGWGSILSPLLPSLISLYEGNNEEILANSLIGINEKFPFLGNNKEIDLFKNALISIFQHMKKTSKELKMSLVINSLFIAYSIAKNKKIASKNPIIFLSIHDCIKSFMECLALEYEDFFWLPSIRLPHKTFDSYLIHLWFNCNLFPRITRLGYGIYHFQQDGCLLPFLKEENQLGIRFEDLHSNAKLVVELLCKKFNIKCYPTLLESTHGGVPWSLDGFSGVDPTSVDRNHKIKILKKIDVFSLHSLLKENYLAWNYEQPSYSFYQRLIYKKIFSLLPFMRIFFYALILDLKHIIFMKESHTNKKSIILKYFSNDLPYTLTALRSKRDSTLKPVNYLKILNDE